MLELWYLFGKVVPIFILIAFGTFLFLYKWKKSKNHFRWREVLPFVFTTLSVIGISLITLTPQSEHEGWKTYNYIPFDNLLLNIKYGGDLWIPIRNLVANLFLFMPFGFSVGWLLQNLQRIGTRSLLFGSFLSLTIEALQWYLPLGRSTDIDDWIMNSIGALLGGVLFVICLKSFRMIRLNFKK
ncbi:VanZ family protein [Bacillus sp. 2205SS5-2]|uniref:VanZ family protein n=1 Tax=Bacillus sp. 2205SS5-2 TaxID=3109031 RepID=UPI00300643D3